MVAFEDRARKWARGDRVKFVPMPAFVLRLLIPVVDRGNKV